MKQKSDFEFFSACMATFMLGNMVGNEHLAGAGMVLLSRKDPKEVKKFLAGGGLNSRKVDAVMRNGAQFFEKTPYQRWRSYMEAAALVAQCAVDKRYFVEASKPIIRHLVRWPS
jgi:hypothetical protein